MAKKHPDTVFLETQKTDEALKMMDEQFGQQKKLAEKQADFKNAVKVLQTVGEKAGTA